MKDFGAKPLARDDLRASRAPNPLPGTILVVRGASVASVRHAQLLRYAGENLRAMKIVTWTAGALSPSTVHEMETVFREQLIAGLLEHFGIQSDFWSEVYSPLADSDGA